MNSWPAAGRVPTAGTSAELRAANRARVLATLVRDGETSRAEVARRCGLSPATVTNVVAGLLAEGLVQTRGRVPSRGGRPIDRLAPRADAAWLLGAHVDDDAVSVALLDLALERRDAERVSLEPGAGPVHVAAALRRAVRALRSRHPDDARYAGLGLSLPGMLEHPREGGPSDTVLHVPGSSWPAVVLDDLVGGLGGTPLSVVPATHATALAAAETWRGGLAAQAPHAGRALAVTLGRDASAAVVDHDGGRPRTAEAGGWGHTTVVPRGRRCPCGRRGCLAAYVRADALVEAWAGRGATPPEDPREALAALVAAAGEGEAAAVTTLDVAADTLAGPIATAVTLTGADAVVVGGWVGDLLVGARGRVLAPAVREAAVTPRAATLSVTGAQVRDLATGAALLVLDRLLG